MYASLYSTLLYCDFSARLFFALLPVFKKKSVCLFVCLFFVQVQRPLRFISLPCDSEVRFFPLLEDEQRDVLDKFGLREREKRKENWRE